MSTQGQLPVAPGADGRDSETAGPEHRYSLPTNDTASIHEATYGAVVKADDHGEMPEVTPESKLNTMGGAPRGTKGGNAPTPAGYVPAAPTGNS